MYNLFKYVVKVSDNMKNEELLSAFKFNMRECFISKYSNQTVLKDNFISKQNYIYKNSEDFLEEFLANSYMNLQNINDQNSINNYFSPEAILYHRSVFTNLEPEKVYEIKHNRKQGDYTDFEKIIFQRKTSYDLKDKLITKAKLFQLLDLGLGLNPTRENRKNYSSAGALYPVEVFLYLKNIEGIAEGFYAFDCLNQKLNLICAIKLSREEISEIIAIEEGLNFNMILFYIYNFTVNKFKYGRAAARFGLIETGIIMHHLDIVSSFLKLSGQHIGAFDQNKIKKYLNLTNFLDLYITNASIIGTT